MAIRGSVSGAIYALVVMVFLFVLGLVLAVVFYAQRAVTQQDLLTAQNDLRRFITPSEQSGEAYDSLSRRAQENGNQTLYAQLRADIQALTRWTTGNGESAITQVEQELRQAGVAEDSSAVTTLRTSSGLLESAHNEIALLQQANADLNQKFTDLDQAFQQAQQASQQKVDELQAQLRLRTDGFVTAEEQGTQAYQDLLARYEQAKTDAAQQVADKEEEMIQLRNEMAKKDARLAELAQIVNRNRLGSPDMTLEADAVITEILSNDNLVYINLGSADRLVLGMTFEVFDEATGVQVGAEENGQTSQVGGKATIEVVRFGETGRSAACRIVRQSFGRPIVTGDLVSNIVYDRNRAFKFYVFGDFDLNNDDVPTSAERARIVNLVQQWGGQVVDADEMPVDTDFLILGTEPDFPVAPSLDPPPTPQEVQRYLQRRQTYTKYFQLADAARELSIPMLNQNRFLTLIGYYQR